MTEEDIRTVAATMCAADVIVYTQPDCAYCAMARQWLDAHGFAYTVCDIAADARCATAYKRLLAIGTPYVVVRRAGRERHLRNGFTRAAFLATLV